MKASATVWLVAVGCMAFAPQVASSNTVAHFPTQQAVKRSNDAAKPCYVRFVNSEGGVSVFDRHALRNENSATDIDFAEYFGLCAPYATNDEQTVEQSAAIAQIPGPPEPIDFTPWIQRVINPHRTLQEMDTLLTQHDLTYFYADAQVSAAASHRFVSKWAGVLQGVWQNALSEPAYDEQPFFCGPHDQFVEQTCPTFVEPTFDHLQPVDEAQVNRQLVLSMARTLDQWGGTLQSWSRRLSQWAEEEAIANSVQGSLSLDASTR